MGFILVVHIIACVLLVIAILMQAGRGGGLTETFQSAESMFGTQTNTFMVRTTTVFAVIFFSTSLILAFNSSKVQKSLMENKKLLSTVAKPLAPAQEASKPASAESPQHVPVNPVTNAAT